MFNVLVEFIHSPQREFIPPKRLNFKFFLSKILKFLFQFENIPAPKKANEKNQMIWGSFLVYLATLNSNGVKEVSFM